MILRKNTLLLLSLFAGALLLLSACSPAGSATSSSLTPLQVLQNSGSAMQKLKTVHIELQSNSGVQTEGASNGKAAPANYTANITGSGDVILPDQEQLKLTVNQNTHIAQVLQGNNVYIQNARGQWYVLDRSRYQGLVGNPFAGVTIDQKSLLGLVSHATITDHGIEALNGQNLRHITADLDKDAVRAMFNENPQLKSLVGQQNIDEVLNRTKSFKSTADVWIDESQFYLHRTALKLNLVADTSGIQGSASSSLTANLDTTVDLSKFNDPVTITPPTNATPTDNPGNILG
ncbi:MAG: LppX_LprAFG lipoprotein [Ktedonobacteraceae bacterium]|nr:LppX_LprAFG lipoprotein [Ktedonobacteraceae bacterium]